MTVGILEVTYKLRESSEGEACGDALTYSLSLVGIEKIQQPVQFVQLSDDGMDHEPIPAGPDGGGMARTPCHLNPITVEFRMDGDVYAQTQLRLNDVTDVPHLTPLPDGFIDWSGGFVPNINTPDAEVAAGGLNRDGDR